MANDDKPDTAQSPAAGDKPAASDKPSASIAHRTGLSKFSESSSSVGGAPASDKPSDKLPTAGGQLKLVALGLDAQEKGEVALPPHLFGLQPRKDILHSMVRWQLARRRAGTHRSKPRSEIQGRSGKAWRQKGSGRARHGNRKANIFRGGGKAHGPVVRSHAHGLPKKVRRLALRHALSAKCRAGELMILDAAECDAGKTAALKAQLAKLQLDHALIVDGREPQAEFQRAAANIARVNVLPEQGINVYDILRHKRLVLTRAALSALTQRLGEAS